MKRLISEDQLEELRNRILGQQDPNKPCIIICGSTGCRAYGAEEVTEAFKNEIAKQGLTKKVDIRFTGCHGFCEVGPLVVISPKRVFYQRVSLSDVGEIISETVVKGNIIERLLYVDPMTDEKITLEGDIAFYKGQQRLVFAANGLIDPTNIGDYIGFGGYSALARALVKMKPQEVVQEIKKSGLRGRGGAGFPTGRKWEMLASQKNGDGKFVVCNGDEGDPGAYMDRSVLEGNPHSIIEGMLIGAYATGATEGIAYVRNEYPLAIKHLLIAMDQARDLGLLGKQILGSDFSFDIQLVKGAGAFVCGEETALIRSIEGAIGEPRPRPPYPVESGIDGKPTVINNVETWANIPIIIGKGSLEFAKTGTKKSSGTKIFSLVGKIQNTGLVEVPMGVTFEHIVYNIGGGPVDGAKIKAVQIGGPSGGCIPAEKFDLPIDFDSLTEAGSMMGSGGLVVMDDKTCMVDVAKFFLKFTNEESCGKCTPCRDGTKQMLDILTRICDGNGQAGDIEKLETMARVIKDTALCGLGATAPNPVLTTLRYFRDEYEAHVKDKQCPGRVCRSLISYRIDAGNCIGCTLCFKKCPAEAIVGQVKNPHEIVQDKCVKCGACLEVCKSDAVLVE